MGAVGRLTATRLRRESTDPLRERSLAGGGGGRPTVRPTDRREKMKLGALARAFGSSPNSKEVEAKVWDSVVFNCNVVGF